MSGSGAAGVRLTLRPLYSMGDHPSVGGERDGSRGFDKNVTVGLRGGGVPFLFLPTPLVFPMKLTYFGHSAFQIETGGTTLLFDPFITGNKHAERKIGVDALQPDIILLTHAHSDHWGDTMRIARRTNALIVGNWEIADYVSRKENYDNTRPMNTGGWWNAPFGRVKMTYARHSSSFPDGTYGGNPNGFVLELEGKTVYNTGDTCPFAEMAWTGEEHAIDLALMPIGDYFTMGPEDALRAVKMLRPKLTVPLHFGTFPNIEIDLNRWTGGMGAAGFKTRVMDAGETLEL